VTPFAEATWAALDSADSPERAQFDPGTLTSLPKPARRLLLAALPDRSPLHHPVSRPSGAPSIRRSPAQMAWPSRAPARSAGTGALRAKPVGRSSATRSPRRTSVRPPPLGVDTSSYHDPSARPRSRNDPRTGRRWPTGWGEQGEVGVAIVGLRCLGLGRAGTPRRAGPHAARHRCTRRRVAGLGRCDRRRTRHPRRPIRSDRRLRRRPGWTTPESPGPPSPSSKAAQWSTLEASATTATATTSHPTHRSGSAPTPSQSLRSR